MESEIAREKRIVAWLFFSLIIIGIFFYTISGKRISVLCSGIIALVFYVLRAVNKYYIQSFSERWDWWLRIGLFVTGTIFLFVTISAIEQIKQL